MTHTQRFVRWIPATVLIVAIAGAAAARQDAALGEDSYRGYRDEGFQGKNATMHPVTSARQGKLQPIDKVIRRKASSLEWNLPPGVVIVFTDDTMGLGKQLPVWGEGRMSALTAADLENKVESWYWGYIDGWDAAPATIRDALSPRPIGTSESKERAPSNSMVLHKDEAVRDKGDDIQTISGVTDLPEGELQPVAAALADRVSSLRWNLPPGVIVVLYENPDGTGRRGCVWGNGDKPNLNWLNDRISVWAWYDTAP